MTTWIRFARFNAVSALGIGVQLATLSLLTTLGANYLAATTIAVTAAVVHNFCWHRRWTWADRDVSVARAFLAFASANGAISLAANLAMMAALVSGIGVNPIVANLIAIGTAGIVNFWVGDRIAFSWRTCRYDGYPEHPSYLTSPVVPTKSDAIHPTLPSVALPDRPCRQRGSRRES